MEYIKGLISYVRSTAMLKQQDMDCNTFVESLVPNSMVSQIMMKSKLGEEELGYFGERVSIDALRIGDTVEFLFHIQQDVATVVYEALHSAIFVGMNAKGQALFMSKL